MRPPAGVRAYARCPRCAWEICWAFDGSGNDADMGLVVGAHIAELHPELLGAERNIWRESLARQLLIPSRLA